MFLRPKRGGFLRPFGTAIFIRDFLNGEGAKYGAPSIDPKAGAPQEDIHAAYKSALHRAFAEDAAAMDAEEAIGAGKPLTHEEVESRREYYLTRIPYKLTRMRYHSFLVYFGMLKRLAWVEPTGNVEPSEIQEAMALGPGDKLRATGQPRIYYRVTDKGKAASLAEVSNPLRVLYPQFTSEYFRQARKGKKYFRRTTRPTVTAPRPKVPPPVEPLPPVQVPAFELPERPVREASQRLIRHLRRLAELNPEASEVQEELERLEGDLQGWLDKVEEAVSPEEEKEEPNEDQLDRLQERHDDLEAAQQALGDQEIKDAIDALERAFPPRGA